MVLYEVLIPGQCVTAVYDHQLSSCVEKQRIERTERQTADSTICYSHLKEGTSKKKKKKSVKVFAIF